jgi:putative membrane protein
MMAEFAELLWKTVLLRPYVFAFLAGYFISASLTFGVVRAALYIPIGYAIAWCSEWLSTHYGIPYGFYRYIPSTVDRELWIGGIPFMDSLSYVFLSYASYGTARLFWARGNPTADHGSSWRFTLLGAALTTLLDVIIDPVALQGDRWFLGKIYEYPEGGFYFGVPLSNFVGWFAVGIVLTRILQHFAGSSAPTPVRLRYGIMLALALYVSVVLFNLAVTIYIKAWGILVADVVLLAVVVSIFWLCYSSHIAISDRS